MTSDADVNREIITELSLPDLTQGSSAIAVLASSAELKRMHGEPDFTAL